ncbi:MAG TPA: DUF3891 family protein [Roseiarcus sp.]|nr:DUF3891 family protein [Roseiarcus sp.]
MLFCNHNSGVLAISQPAHAWISGQLLRAWAEPLGEPLLLAAEQHDIGWLDWEAAPTFDPETGRPHLFRHVGAATHAPMWARGVEQALGAWGAHVALLISMHGGLIYRRFTDRHRMSEADARAAENYLATQASREATWMQALRLNTAEVKKESSLVAFADALSLALCGDLKAPMTLEAFAQNGDPIRIELIERPGRQFEFVLAPWPFTGDALTVEGEARRLPPEGRFSREAAMRSWLASPARETFRAMLFAA